MRNLLLLLFPLLVMMACASPASENEEWIDLDLIALRSGMNISAEMTDYQLLGKRDDFANIEFTVNSEKEKLPELIIFKLKINSSFDFEGRFSVSKKNEDLYVSKMENIGENTFSIVLALGDPGDIAIEDVACLAPPPGGCGTCVECITLEVSY